MKYNSHSLKQTFLQKAKEKFGDKYDYSLVDYINSHKKIKIICPQHGIFEKTPASHLYGAGECKLCHYQVSKYKRNTQEDFLNKVKNIHGDKYDYSNSQYIGFHLQIKINCPIHGEFITTPKSLISKKMGCQQCGKLKWRESVDRRILDFDEFTVRANKIHKNEYQYVKDTTYSNKIKIICSKHGEFYQNIWNHLKGVKCPKCSNHFSQQEELTKKFFNENNILYSVNNRTILNGKEIDILIPSKNLGIELDGIYWHSELQGKDKNYHLNKTKLCQEKNIQLLHIFENEVLKSPQIVISRLKTILNLNKYSIYARKCQIKEIDNSLKNKFLNKYHLQGSDKSSVKLGLFYKNRLVSVMTFGKLRKALGQTNKDDFYEMIRFASMSNFNIVGGASKLLKYFERNYNPKYIKTYADKRWSIGNLYKKLGFVHTHDSEPNYWYFQDVNKLFHRFGFRKNILLKKLNNFNPDLSEWENMKANGWNRIWDCGNMVFEKNY